MTADQITYPMIRAVRDETGASHEECRQVLEETGGDVAGAAALWFARKGARAAAAPGAPHRRHRPRVRKELAMLDVEYTDPMQFSYWAPLGSGGFVVSKIEQRTEFNFEANVRYIQAAERTGFDYALMPARYFVSHGWPSQFEAMTTSAGLTQVTSRIKILSALHPGLWHPGIVAKMGATIDHMSGGRWGLNITTGWFKEEFIGFGEPWLDHDERYRRSEEFIRVLTGLWTEDEFSFAGDFYRIHDAPLRPKPLAKPRPEIFQGGNSMASRRVAARVVEPDVHQRPHAGGGQGDRAQRQGHGAGRGAGGAGASRPRPPTPAPTTRSARSAAG